MTYRQRRDFIYRLYQIGNRVIKDTRTMRERMQKERGEQMGGPDTVTEGKADDKAT